MRQIGRGKGIFVAMGILAVVLLFSGCTHLKRSKKEPSNTVLEPMQKGATPLYYDFGDILIPSEMKIDKEKSFVYRTPRFSAGVLSMKGRVEPSSLIAFFENNMGKDNWRPVSSFKSTRSIMLFQKENRWCVINITEKKFTTYAEVWVAPTTDGSETELLR